MNFIGWLLYCCIIVARKNTAGEGDQSGQGEKVASVSVPSVNRWLLSICNKTVKTRQDGIAF